MGMVFQHFALLPQVQGVDRATREARAREVIELVGLAGDVPVDVEKLR